MKLMPTIAGAAMALAMTLSAQAHTLLTGSDTGAILDAAKLLGTATLAAQPNGDPLIDGKIGDLGYQIYFKNCTNNAACEDLNFYAGFGGTKPTIAVINDWNRDKRFGRAYLDEVQDAAVEMDLDLVKGVTPDYLASQMGLWSLVVAEFSTHIGYK
ncbi:YbjN domain-containing protein [Devosia psychrophila]|uniref:Putative sensory transduction regulator n=1 Tax=Devosia psychrophila TaxID=728005 RepID=A0A1I1L0Q1_9HYPH|nr:YbjN domain-containing protein [Devosia psychrophila]SFC66657.1 Putative sensory transduction regulator [Devosia psychrophila]